MTSSTEPAKGWPRVSVIIPTYNRAGLVCAAIDSVLAQNYPNLEIVVVDDGSTDGTAEAVQNYGAAVRFVSQANAGAASARNRGIRLATGDLVAFLDSDDLYLPGKLQEQVQYFNQQPETVLVYCWFTIFDESGRKRLGRRCHLTGNIAAKLLAKCMQGPLATPTVMVRRDALLRVGGFDEAMNLSEDTDLWCRVARLGPVGLIPEPLVAVRRHSGNLSSGPGRTRFLAASLRILDKAFAEERGGDPRQRTSVARRWQLYAKAHVWSWLVAAAGLLPGGLSFWLRAWWTNPLVTARQWFAPGSVETPQSVSSVPAERRRVA